MVTGLIFPPSALGFSLDSNNQYIITVNLYLDKILELIKDINVNSYLRHHLPKYKYTIYINGVIWKSIDYIELTNSHVQYANEDISGYLISGAKQTLSCTVEVSHPQFFCKLQSENYTFVVINKKSQQLKALNSSTGQYETIGLSFSNLSSSEKNVIDSVRWPLFNTENSSQQFVVPIGSASYTRRNGSIRAERFGGSAGQYFNLSTNQYLNKDYRANNGTEYRYVDSFSPAFKYYTNYYFAETHYYTTTSSSEWATPTRAAPTLTTGENETGRYTSYAFGGWARRYNFRIDYFIDARVYAPNQYSISFANYKQPYNIDNVPDVDGCSIGTEGIYVWGADFRVEYRNAEKYVSSTYWPAYEHFITRGSVYLNGYERYSDEIVFDRWNFSVGTKDYYYCIGRYEQRYFPNIKEEGRSYRYYTNMLSGPTNIPAVPEGWNGPGSVTRYTYLFSEPRYVISRYYTAYMDGRGYSAAEYVTNGRGESWYEKWTGVYKNKYLAYYWYLYRTYTTKSSTITGTLYGNEYAYKRWWYYEYRKNWYIDYDSIAESIGIRLAKIKYRVDLQIAITNDTDTYLTS